MCIRDSHATDPCCGKLMNAFDVVRLHKFGEKDARAAEGMETGKLPSFKAMQEFAAQDEQVKATLARKRQELAAAEFSETEEDWQSRLVIDRRGNIRAVSYTHLIRKRRRFDGRACKVFPIVRQAVFKLPAVP